MDDRVATVNLVEMPVVVRASLEVDPMVVGFVVAVEVPLHRSVHHPQAVREVTVLHGDEVRTKSKAYG